MRPRRDDSAREAVADRATRATAGGRVLRRARRSAARRLDPPPRQRLISRVPRRYGGIGGGRTRSAAARAPRARRTARRARRLPAQVPARAPRAQAPPHARRAPRARLQEDGPEHTRYR